MSAFNDYCIVCDKLCSSHSAYCSDECKLQDTSSHFKFNNVPQLISPVLQPRNDSISTTLSSASFIDTEDEEVELDENNEQNDNNDHEYLIKSPLLLSSHIKDHQQPITGLNLDDIILKETECLDFEHAQLLAASSNNYRKWLNVVL